MAVHLLRHASAAERHEWELPDDLRPLTPKGTRQASDLADRMTGGRPIERLLSSRYVRCLETLEPLATRLGLPVEQHPALAEEAGVPELWDLLESLSGTEAVCCTHGNLIGPVLDRLRRRGAELVAVRPGCAKASVWTLHPDGERVFDRAVYRPPPA